MSQLFLFEDDEEEEKEDNDLKDTKICRICKTEKGIDEFSIDRGVVYSRCKECCSKQAKILREIKKNAPPYPSDGKCQCCNKVVENWYCDHDHNTNKFRGWVCFECNTGIGYLGDNIEGISNAYFYLLKHKSSMLTERDDSV